MIDMDQSLFESLTGEHSPILVEFWSSGCHWCRRITPTLKRVAARRAGTLAVGRVDIDLEPRLARQEQIEVVPTLVLYRGGKALGSIVVPESGTHIEDFLYEVLAE